MIFIGLDPGMRGGITVMDDSGEVMACFALEDMSERKVYDSLHKYVSTMTYAVLEHVHAMPGAGTIAMFKLGQSYGFLLGMLTARFQYEVVTATKWQSEFNLKGPKKETYDKKKRRHRDRAREMFPHVEIDLDTADSIFIAEYCRRRWKRGFQ